MIRIFLLCLFAFQFYDALDQKRTLVLLDNWAIRESHSRYFKLLKDRGHKLTYKTADDASLALFEYKEPLYENLVLFSPTVREFGGKIDVKAIVDFIDAGGNLLITANNKVGEAIQKLASECGAELDEEGSALIDHANFDINDSGKHTLVISDAKQNLLKVSKIVGQVQENNAFLYRGIGFLNDPDNPLIVSVLHGSPSSYSFHTDKPIKDYPTAVGSTTQMISVIQARNNARIVISGSLDFFSDEFFTAHVKHGLSGQDYGISANEQLAEALSRWNFQETGVIRTGNVTHKKLRSSDSAGRVLSLSEAVYENTGYYTILDEVEYTLEVEEKVDADPMGRIQKWVPLRANDLQMEFVRIDPFVRTTLDQKKDGLFYKRFKLPDVYGVYKFKVDYNKLGYSRLLSITQVSVRPLRHTQYERFIESAYPYYFSAFSMMFGVVVFSFLFLHYRSDKKDKSE